MRSISLQPARMRRTLVGIVQDIGTTCEQLRRRPGDSGGRIAKVDKAFRDKHHGAIL